MNVRVVRLSYNDYLQLKLIGKTFLVLFYPKWKLKYYDIILSKLIESVSNTGITIVFTLEIINGSSIEDYLIDKLAVSSVPIVELCSNGDHIQYFNEYEFADVSTLLQSWIQKLSIHNLLKPEDTFLQKFLNIAKNDDIAPIIGKLFISGDRSSVGKSSVCLGLLVSLIRHGLDPKDIAYIKPVTQCEAEQPVSRFCARLGIEHQSIGPVVFYKGFTRAFLDGETESSEELLNAADEAVRNVSNNKKLVIIDGVGYPSVGSICGISNADVASKLSVPVLLISKSGVGDAVDSYNLNSTYFEAKGVTVLGAIFNKISLDGYYNITNCSNAINKYFMKYKPTHTPYGYLPIINNVDANSTQLISTNDNNNDNNNNNNNNNNRNIKLTEFEKALSDAILEYIQLDKIIYDVWFTRIMRNSVTINRSHNYDIFSSRNSNMNSSTNTNRSVIANFNAISNSKTGRKRTREEVEALAAAQGAKKGG